MNNGRIVNDGIVIEPSWVPPDRGDPWLGPHPRTYLHCNVDYLTWQLRRFGEFGPSPALIWRDRTTRYDELAAARASAARRLEQARVPPGACVALVADASPAGVAWLLALLARRAVVVPLGPDSRPDHAEFREIARVEHVVRAGDADRVDLESTRQTCRHPLVAGLRERGEAGLVLFSSGSSGRPKAVLHGFERLSRKFRKPGRRYVTLGFLMFDHIGGVNTLCYTLANGGCLVVPDSRRVDRVVGQMTRHGVELLPTTPSFLNLLLAGGSERLAGLSALELITYGTEVMPEATLAGVRKAFPGVRLKQTYGLSELGILPTRSVAPDSLMFEIGREGQDVRIVDGRLQLRVASSMLGYLNADSPFDADGWFDTGDRVVREGDAIRVLGRQSEIINCGGQKVFPAQVEDVIARMPGVIDVTVAGESHLLLGEVVTAVVQTAEPESPAALKRRVRKFCRGRLQDFMIPVKVRPAAEPLVNRRFKKARSAS